MQLDLPLLLLRTTRVAYSNLGHEATNEADFSPQLCSLQTAARYCIRAI